MNPKQWITDIRASALGKAADKAHDVADQVYQNLTRPDRPLEAEIHKKPWLAALLSLVVVGSGQLYNRQLLKAVTLFISYYVLSTGLLIGYLVYWLTEVGGERFTALLTSMWIAWAGLWLFAVIDAYRTAEALRAGRLLVRYGFFRQGVFGLYGMIPLAGELAPEETISPDEVNQRVGHVVQNVAIRKLWRRYVMRWLRLGGVALGVVVLAAGLMGNIPPLIIGGTLIIVAGILLGLL
ncbi:MAG: hypothetical protein ACK4RK_06310 [Gemmataceae bacterium]